MENLNRGLVVIRRTDNAAFASWRFLGTDSPALAFHLYRATGKSPPVRVTAEPLTESTSYAENQVNWNETNTWWVRPVLNGRDQSSSAPFVIPANTSARPWIRIPLRTPAGYAPNDGSVGDLDGDGEYEIVLHQAGRGRDNSQRGTTDPPILEAYRLDGTFLWRINLGRNIREGAHYTQFIVYDLDGDGYAELVCKTADGTTDGSGVPIGNPDADYRNVAGYILEGPEFLTVFEGKTGKALATIPYLPPRGRVADWGDDYGNRVDRFLACVAYLDGRCPSVVFCRGYYTRTVLTAWNWRKGMWSHQWTFDTDAGSPDHRAYRGQGNHNLSVGDIDGDGKDEILCGACCIDDNGRGLYTTGLGHGDALHLSDLDPDRPGLEIFSIHERPTHGHGVSFLEARSGKVLWGKPSTDVGRAAAFDIDPRHRGCETWASGSGLSGYWNVKGEQVSSLKPRSCNFGIWWDGDLLRELLDRNIISKWNWENQTESRLLTAEGCAANNGSKATPVLCADVLGDWREEVIFRTADNQELRLFTSPLPTHHRLYTLMHDPQYRLSVAWQNVAYNLPPQPGFYLGHDMKPPAPPPIQFRKRRNRTPPRNREGHVVRLVGVP